MAKKFIAVADLGDAFVPDELQLVLLPSGVQTFAGISTYLCA
jgi:hypothetical protein